MSLMDEYELASGEGAVAENVGDDLITPLDEEKKPDAVQGEEAEGGAEEKPEPEQEPEKKPEQKAVAPQDYSAQHIANLQQQLGSIQEQLRRAQEAQSKAKGIEKPEDHPLWPKEEDWARDPSGAAKRAYQINWEFDKRKLQQEMAQREQQRSHVENLRRVQEQSWGAAAQLVPALNADTPHRKIATALLNDPATGLANLPSGALAAAAMADFLIRHLGGQGEQAQLSEGKATQESSRVAAVKKGAMTTSGKGGKTPKTKDLSREEADIVRRFGISKEAFLKAKEQTGVL